MDETPMSAEQIEDFDRRRRVLYRRLVILGEIIEAHGGPKQAPIPWVPTRECVPQGLNLELACLSGAAPTEGRTTGL